MLMASYGVENWWKRPSMSAKAPAPPPATQRRPPSSALAPITLPGRPSAPVYIFQPALSCTSMSSPMCGPASPASGGPASLPASGTAASGTVASGGSTWSERDWLPPQAAAAAQSAMRRRMSVPLVDGDGAVLESDQHFARRGRRDLDVEHGALLQRSEDGGEVLHRAVLADARDAAFELVADPQAAVGVDGDGAHVLREERGVEVAEHVPVV